VHENAEFPSTREAPMRTKFTYSLTLVLLFTIANVGWTQTVINVPADVPTIQQAINAAENGDTILVADGTYRENLLIDKSITIEGESDRGTRVVASNRTQSTVVIEADGVELREIQIRNGSIGVFAENVDNTVIVDSRITANRDGIVMENSRDLIIENVRVSQSDIGISVIDGRDALIEDCRSFRNRVGFYCDDTRRLEIVGCLAFDNRDAGIELLLCDKPLVMFSQGFRNGFAGISAEECDNCQIISNSFNNNDGCGIAMADCEDSTADDNFTRGNFDTGILCFGTNCVLTNNLSRDNFFGIEFEGEGGVVASNLARDNESSGFEILGNGILAENNTARRNELGFHFDWSDSESRFNKSSQDELGYCVLGDGNLYFDNTAESSEEEGFIVEDETNSVFSKNVAIRCGGSGFVFLPSADNNLVTGNFAGLNGGFGFVDSGFGNTFDFNFCDDEGNAMGGSSPPGLCD